MSEFIAEAQVLITPNVAGFAASLRKQVEAAVAVAGPVSIPVLAAGGKGLATTTAATSALVAAQSDAQASALGLQSAEKVLNSSYAAQATILPVVTAETLEKAGADVVATSASRAAAKAEAQAVRVHAQAARGLAAEALSLTGLRGATLAASGPFLLGATAAIVFAKSIKAASDETESLNKAVEVFGSSAQEVEDFAKTTARALGISSQEALESASTFGNLFRAIKITEPVAASMSVRLVQLAADLASFNNADPTRVLEALRSGLVGQARPLRVFGIFLSAARVQQEALIETGKQNVKSLSEAEKAQARFNIILDDSVIAQGDVNRTAGSLANQSRFLKAQISDLSASLGQQLVPGLTNVVGTVGNVVAGFQDLLAITGRAAGDIKGVGQEAEVGGGKLDSFRKGFADLLSPGKEALIVTREYRNILDKVAGVAPKAATAINGLADSLDAGARAASNAAFALVQAQRALTDIGQVLAGLEVQRLKIQTGLTGGGRPAEEANLRTQIEEDKKAVEQQKSGTEARRKALEELKADQDALANLLQQDASDAADRAQKIRDAEEKRKQAAEKAARAQADATKAFIESFTAGRQGLQNALARAGLDDTLKNEIALNKKIIAFDLAEIRAIRDRIRHLHLHGEALKAAQEAIRRINQEITDTRLEIQKDQQAQQDAAKALVLQRLDLRIQLAQARDNTKAEIRARRARLEELTKELARLKNAGKKNTIAWLELKVQQAEEIAAIKELEKKNKEKKNAQASLFFQFLQTQQGFAANLLGNLIPGFATGGLVGGSQAAATPTPGQAFRGEPQDRVSQQAAVAGSRDRGVRPVQVDTTNQLLRQILRSLQNLNGRTQHPEARHNRAVGSAILDTMGGVHGA